MRIWRNTAIVVNASNTFVAPKVIKWSKSFAESFKSARRCATNKWRPGDVTDRPISFLRQVNLDRFPAPRCSEVSCFCGAKKMKKNCSSKPYKMGRPESEVYIDRSRTSAHLCQRLVAFSSKYASVCFSPSDRFADFYRAANCIPINGLYFRFLLNTRTYVQSLDSIAQFIKRRVHRINALHNT
ncbi:unnamed protein product [Xylocopa violacea]|uniref:Uncharacterized protein n=1 Tax=Xylocopa violacea TaxID=135666 RepID=A0ABP1NVQ7_XYLVO